MPMQRRADPRDGQKEVPRNALESLGHLMTEAWTATHPFISQVDKSHIQVSFGQHFDTYTNPKFVFAQNKLETKLFSS